MILFMYPDEWTPEQKESDWRYKLMQGVIKSLQQSNDISFFPVVSPKTTAATAHIPSLAPAIGIVEEEFPNFFFFHSKTRTVKPFDQQLDDETTFSPEVIIILARIQMLELDLEP